MCCMVIVMVTLTCPSVCHGVGADEPSVKMPIWYGVMDAGGREFRFVLQTTADADGVESHSLVSLDEGDQVFVLDRMEITDDAMEFDLNVSAAQFRGQRESDIVTGKWLQGGNEIDLSFQQFEERPADEPTEVWSGEIDAIIQKLKMQLRVYAQDDGSEKVRLDSLTQKAGGFLAYRTVDGTSVNLEVPALAGKFEGTLDESGTGIVGSWTQNGVTMNMTLNRSTQPVVMSADAPKRPQTPQPPFPYESLDVEVENSADDVLLSGTLTIPHGTGPFPAAILVSGSGPQDRDEAIVGHRPFLVLADHLSRNGIAVLRYDDRGVGKSTGEFKLATTADFAADATAAFEFLKQRSQIDADAIGVIGHSEGGLVAPMVAAERPDVAFIVLLAGPGVNGEKILLSQGELILRSAGVNGQTEIRAQRILQTAMIDAVLRSKPGDDAATLQQRVLKKLAASLPAESMEDEQVPKAVQAGIATLNTAWFKYFLQHEPGPVLRKVKCPVLALTGEKDVQVDPKLNLPAIRTALKAGGNSDFELLELTSLNHLFQTCRTGAVSEYSTIEETMAPAVLEQVAAWIRSHVE
jgi:uncharacterized protein